MMRACGVLIGRDERKICSSPTVSASLFLLLRSKRGASQESAVFFPCVINRMKRYWNDRKQAEEVTQAVKHYKPIFVPVITSPDM